MSIEQFAVSAPGQQIPLSTRQQLLADQLIQQKAADTSTPIVHKSAGYAKLLAGALGGLMQGMEAREIDDRQQAAHNRFADIAMKSSAAFKGGESATSPQSPAAGSGQGAGSSENAAKAMAFFQGKGLSPVAAAGLVGGFQGESTAKLNPSAVNPQDGHDGSSSIGIGQWNGSRGGALRQYAAANGLDPNDLQTQLEFTWQELNGPERATLAALQASKTPEQATAAALGYERPAGWSAANPQGASSYAQRLANTNALAGGGQVQTASADPSFAPPPGYQPQVQPDAPQSDGSVRGDVAAAFRSTAPLPPERPPQADLDALGRNSGDLSLRDTIKNAAQPQPDPPHQAETQVGAPSIPGDIAARPDASNDPDRAQALADGSTADAAARGGGFGSLDPNAFPSSDQQTLAMALAQYQGGSPAGGAIDPNATPGQSTIGGDVGASQAYAQSPGAARGVLAADGGIAAGADAGVPSMVSAGIVGARVGDPFNMLGDGMGSGSGMADTAPLPPVRPDQASIDAMAGGPADMPAPNAVQASGSGLPGDMMSSPASAPMATPQNGGGDPSSAQAFYDQPQSQTAILGGLLSGSIQAPQSTPAGPDRQALVSALGGGGSPAQVSPQNRMVAQALGGGSTGGSDSASSYQQELHDALADPYTSDADRALIEQRLMMPAYSYQKMDNGALVRLDNRGGAPVVVYQGGGYGATREGGIFNKGTGLGPDGKPVAGFRPATPDELRANNLPADASAQVGPNGKLTLINPGAAGNPATEYNSKVAGAIAEPQVALMNGVEPARERLRSLNEMSGAIQRLQQNGGTTGMGQDEVMHLQSAINSGAGVLGITTPFDISDKEVLNKLNKQVAAAQTKGMAGGRTTNFDFQNFQEANPGLEMSPTGNQRMLGIMSQVEQRNIAVGQQMRDFAAREQAAGRRVNPVQMDQFIGQYDATHHITDPVTGQDISASPRLPDLQGSAPPPALPPSQAMPGQGGAGGLPGSSARPAAPQPAADPLGQARAAIARGAPRAAVIQRLQGMGINPAGL